MWKVLSKEGWDGPICLSLEMWVSTQNTIHEVEHGQDGNKNPWVSQRCVTQNYNKTETMIYTRVCNVKV